jgi:hypothetical protein
MVSLVEKMLSLHKQLPESLARLTRRRHCNGASRPRTGRSTGARLYGLTEEEIGIVEGKTGCEKVSI